MVTRAPSFDDLATWDDAVAHGIRTIDDDDDEPAEPTSIDPRPLSLDVVSIDNNIIELESQLKALRLQRSQLLGKHALINRMPPELLSRVFELGVHEQTHLLPSLSLVSKHWRNVALLTPSIWTYIRLDHDWGYARHAAFLRKLSVYTSRSQACKLLIDIDCRYVEIVSELEQIMSALEPHLHRCFSFRMSVPDWEWMEVVRRHAQYLGPALEELYVRLDPTDSEDQTPFVLLSKPCPRLSVVTLEHTPLIAIRTELPSLRRLHLIRDQRFHSSRIGISFRELFSLLTSTPTLQELRIHSALFLLDGSEAIFQSSPQPTSLPSLSSLTFHFVDSNNLVTFLESALLPSLTRLSVQMDPSADENLHWLVRLALDSPTRLPALRHLDLRSCSIDGAAIVPFVRALYHLPTITALGLSSPPSGHIGARIFDVLARAPADWGEAWLLPRLEALCLQNCRDVSGHEILRVVRARNVGAQGVAAIRYVKVSQCYALDPDVQDQLKRLVDVVRVL
ncbi:hypothetical protein EW146_g4173 [Bondarzewia mesenterica]|uniref:Uncharacterized protein n=1 Tax=Bondarzewia mesenterica TaxID=1095465 RepID=A0A4S4LVH8_9AGAM|nr:hypothetical protein EW146_g4173 [Bondarzewia mesenterica]